VRQPTTIIFSVEVYVGGEPMQVPRRHFLDKETAWRVIDDFLHDDPAQLEIAVGTLAVKGALGVSIAVAPVAAGPRRPSLR
jgi:hypothetical protein